MNVPLVIRPGMSIPAADLSFRAVRASGPGGQNVNKVATKVELRFDLEGTSSLSPEVKARLRALAARRLDAEGGILVVSQATRDQQRNLEDARAKLAELIVRATERPPQRRPTRPTRSADRRRLEEKHHQATRKLARSRRDD